MGPRHVRSKLCSVIDALSNTQSESISNTSPYAGTHSRSDTEHIISPVTVTDAKSKSISNTSPNAGSHSLADTSSNTIAVTVTDTVTDTVPDTVTVTITNAWPYISTDAVTNSHRRPYHAVLLMGSA